MTMEESKSGGPCALFQLPLLDIVTHPSLEAQISLLFNWSTIQRPKGKYVRNKFPPHTKDILHLICLDFTNLIAILLQDRPKSYNQALSHTELFGCLQMHCGKKVKWSVDQLFTALQLTFKKAPPYHLLFCTLMELICGESKVMVLNGSFQPLRLEHRRQTL